MPPFDVFSVLNFFWSALLFVSKDGRYNDIKRQVVTYSLKQMSKTIFSYSRNISGNNCFYSQVLANAVEASVSKELILMGDHVREHVGHAAPFLPEDN